MEFFPPVRKYSEYSRTAGHIHSQDAGLYRLRRTLPASLASSSFGTPLIFVCLTAEHFLLSWDWALNFTQFMILSTIPQDVA